MIRKLRAFLENDQLLRKGLSDTNYYFLAQAGSRVLGLLIVPLFTRLLSVHDFAAYDLFILSSGLLVLLSGLGMDSGMAIKIAESRNDTSTQPAYLVTTLAANALALVVFWAIAAAIVYTGILDTGFSPFFVHGVFLYALFYQFNYVVYSFLRWQGNARFAALINFASYVLGIGGGLGFMFAIGHELNNYILGSIAGSSIGAAMTWYIARKFLRWQSLSRADFTDLMKLSVPYIPTYLSNYFMQFISRLLITTWFGLATLGLYALASRIGQVVTFGLQIFSSGFRPVVTSNYDNEDGKRLSRRIATAYCYATVPFALISIFASPLLVRAFGGEQYNDAVVILPYVLLSSWFLAAFYLFGFGYQIKRRTHIVTFITLGVLVSICVLSWPLTLWSGYLGVAQATLISSVVGALVYVFVSERLYPFRYNQVLVATTTLAATILVFIVRFT